MKYLRSFETKTDYNVAKANGEILKPSVTFVENKLYYESLPVTVAGDIAVYDKADEKFRFLSYSSYVESYHQDGTLVPMGVVVVPSTHTPDNTSRVMSLVNMSYSSPDTGTNTTGSYNGVNMYWGGKNVDLELKDFNQVVTVDGNFSATDPNDEGVSYGSPLYLYLPGTDPAWTAIENLVDPGTHWYATSDTHGPSPYLSDGSRSKVYLKEENNCLWDFDGKGNTDVIMAAQTADWSGTTITNNYNAGNYPAACCCRRFSTIGTSSGDWYLPAIGELAYLPVRLKEINLSLMALEKYVSAIRVGGINSQWPGDTYGGWCWSSSEQSYVNARHVNNSVGCVSSQYKAYTSSYNRVRAFIAI